MVTAQEVSKYLKPRHARRYSRQIASIIDKLQPDEIVLSGTLTALYAQGPELEGIGVLTGTRLIVALTGQGGDKWDAFDYSEIDIEWDRGTAAIEPSGLILSFPFSKDFSQLFAEQVHAAGGRTLKT